MCEIKVLAFILMFFRRKKFKKAVEDDDRNSPVENGNKDKEAIEDYESYREKFSLSVAPKGSITNRAGERSCRSIEPMERVLPKMITVGRAPALSGETEVFLPKSFYMKTHSTKRTMNLGTELESVDIQGLNEQSKLIAGQESSIAKRNAFKNWTKFSIQVLISMTSNPNTRNALILSTSSREKL